MSKIKVMHLLQSNKFSGAENVVFQIFNMFKTDNDVDMIYCCKRGEIENNLNVECIPFLPLNNFNFKCVKKAIKEYKPDIIHAHDAAASVMASLCSKKIKIISHVHGNHENMRKVSLKTLLMLFSSKRFDRIFWVSNSALEDFVFKNKVIDKSSLLVNVINKENIVKKAKQDNKEYNYDCVILGRINNIKNPLRALDIIKKCCLINNTLRFAFIGDGDLLNDCKRFVTNNNLTDNVDFLGFVANPLGVLSQSKILLMTSIYEGTPMCALEAMALEKPIVSTPTDGLVDLIDNQITGFYSNDNDVLVNSILSLTSDSKLLEKFSKETSKRFEQLMNIENYKKTIKEEYLIGRKK